MEGEQAKQRFYDFVWPLMPAVLRTAQILCGGNTADAEDLAQETMLKAFRSLDRFQPGTGMKAWLLAILRNARIDRIRSTASGSPAVSLEALGADPPDRPECTDLDHGAAKEDPTAVLNTFSDQQVITAMGRLPEEIRWTLLLVDVEEMEHQEAAEVLHVPVGTIKSRAHRGRAILREALLPAAKRARIVKDDSGQEDGSDGHPRRSRGGSLGESDEHA